MNVGLNRGDEKNAEHYIRDQLEPQINARLDEHQARLADRRKSEDMNKPPIDTDYHVFEENPQKYRGLSLRSLRLRGERSKRKKVRFPAKKAKNCDKIQRSWLKKKK